ncbi:MAG: hypothetical protein ABSG34_18770 [Candidatus Sulfotelmatobacter sp.]|jgi:hypothetical protein
MLNQDLLSAVAEQMMKADEVVVCGRMFRVTRTGAGRLRTFRFAIEGKEYQAIEQNAEKPSRWGKLAREGHRVVQLRDVASGKYVGVVVDGKVTEYSR